MPYLGQQDAALPWKPSVLVPRDKVINYPTDFAAMSEDWIEALSNRGEQLTRVLASAYLSALVV
jgi:NTE family protein